MAYQGQQPPSPLMDMSEIDPLTLEDVQARQERLDQLGLGEGMLGRLNQWSGDMVKQRDALRTQVKTSLMDAVGMKSGAASGAGGQAALGSAAKGSTASGALGSSL